MQFPCFVVFDVFGGERDVWRRLTRKAQECHSVQSDLAKVGRGRSETQTLDPTPDLLIEDLHFLETPGASKLCTVSARSTGLWSPFLAFLRWY